MTDLSQLLEKVRKAKAGSRELDAEIQRALAGNSDDHWYNFAGIWTQDEDAALLTSSLDAIVALIEQELPGEWPELLRAAMDEMWVLHAPKMPLEHLPRLACAAFLSALISKEKADG